MTAEQVAQLFHETYEKLAPEYGYETRKETAIPWSEIPADNANKQLMIAVAREIITQTGLAEAASLIAQYDTYLAEISPFIYRDGKRAKGLRELKAQWDSLQHKTEGE